MIVIEFLFELLGLFAGALAGGGDVLADGLCPAFFAGCEGALGFCYGPGAVVVEPDDVAGGGVEQVVGAAIGFEVVMFLA